MKIKNKIITKVEWCKENNQLKVEYEIQFHTIKE